MTTRRAVLAVIDGAAPAALTAAIDSGRAPALAAIAERGSGVRPLAAAFPSVTPVCATAIATGALQDRHGIPGMNWYSRRAGRYVEYGSSFKAARRHGIGRQLVDTVYRLNGEHLSRGVRTVFETFDDAGLRTAGTTFLVYRGRHRHEVSKETALARIAGTLFKEPVLGPRELFYADVFASRETGCRSQLGKPGMRDQHAGCVSAYLAERDLFDFLLLSLPDNDTTSHRFGPEAQADAIVSADAEIGRVAEAAGGLERFLDTHAIVVCSDHAHALVERTVDPAAPFADWPVAQPARPARERRPSVRRAREAAEIAICPNGRAAMVYVLEPAMRASALPELADAATVADGVDLVCWRDEQHAVVRSPTRGELRFTRGSDLRDDRGNGWDLSGEPGVLELEVSRGRLHAGAYPDPLRRIWAALTCTTSGDLLLSAVPGVEFLDWGGSGHVGGGSHGSLHRTDTLGSLLSSGCDLEPSFTGAGSSTASLSDVAPMLYRYFGLA